MSWKHLGTVFDIHGGGIDLTFPHHENEIAQSRCAHGTDVMARVWMHNGFLQVEGEKMSKSLGNFITINELLGQYHGSVLRMNMLRTHYRQPIDWQRRELERTRHELWNWSDLIVSAAVEEIYLRDSDHPIDPGIIAALEDDLNTSQCLSRLHELSTAARRDRTQARNFAAAARFLGLHGLENQGNFTDSFVSYVPDHRQSDYFKVLPDLVAFKNYSANGQLQIAEVRRSEAAKYGVKAEFKNGTVVISFDGEEQTETVEQRVQRLIAARLEARKRKDFKESDRIRDELAAMGVTLKDTKNKETGEIETTWELAR
jgi:cysteinyl-tRNA synthetase